EAESVEEGQCPRARIRGATRVPVPVPRLEVLRRRHELRRPRAAPARLFQTGSFAGRRPTHRRYVAARRAGLQIDGLNQYRERYRAPLEQQSTLATARGTDSGISLWRQNDQPGKRSLGRGGPRVSVKPAIQSSATSCFTGFRRRSLARASRGA